MVTYCCTKCQKLFNHKSDFLKHQNRKFKCFQNDDYHENGIKSNFESSVLKMVHNNEKNRLSSEGKHEIRDLSGKNDYHKTLPSQKNEKNEDYQNGNEKPKEVGITTYHKI